MTGARRLRRGTPALLLLSLLLPAAAAAQRPDTIPTPRVPDAVLDAIPRGLFFDAGVAASAALGWEDPGPDSDADGAGLGVVIALGYAGSRLAARAGGELVAPGGDFGGELRVTRFLLLDVSLLGRSLGPWRPAFTGGYVHQNLSSSRGGDRGDSHGARLGLALERPFRERTGWRLEAGGDLFQSETGEWYAVPRVALVFRWSPPPTR